MHFANATYIPSFSISGNVYKPTEHRPIKFVPCPYIRPGCINGILRNFKYDDFVLEPELYFTALTTSHRLKARAIPSTSQVLRDRAWCVKGQSTSSRRMSFVESKGVKSFL